VGIRGLFSYARNSTDNITCVARKPSEGASVQSAPTWSDDQLLCDLQCQEFLSADAGRIHAIRTSAGLTRTGSTLHRFPRRHCRRQCHPHLLQLLLVLEVVVVQLRLLLLGVVVLLLVVEVVPMQLLLVLEVVVVQLLLLGVVVLLLVVEVVQMQLLLVLEVVVVQLLLLGVVALLLPFVVLG